MGVLMFDDDKGRVEIRTLHEESVDLAKRRAAEAIKLKKPQDFDLSPLPLWSDARNQKELF